LFFRKVFEHVISIGQGFIILAFHQSEVIAGATFFMLGKKALYKYGASDRRFHDIRPNNLILWEAIKWFRRAGFDVFSFGRTDPENEGLLQFKRGWGTTEKKIVYYKYDLKKKKYDSKKPRLKNSYVIFKRMPLPLLCLTGRILYRHIG
jgi:lipid II:glycine glycyltransferase (peptidoglycan interpeptide bridge formation enzyme)